MVSNCGLCWVWFSEMQNKHLTIVARCHTGEAKFLPKPLVTQGMIYVLGNLCQI